MSLSLFIIKLKYFASGSAFSYLSKAVFPLAKYRVFDRAFN